MSRLKVVVQYDDVKINSTNKTQVTFLNVDNVISATSNPSALISGDNGNELTVGSDKKLLLETDKLQTSFNYASSVNIFWSI